MTVYFDNLYENILKTNATKYKELNIISGYASASFLNEFADAYPFLKINLYVGMTQQGISFKNHERFIAMQNNNSNVNIYYQIKGDNTHIKALEFSSGNSNITYFGSANFTSNGFNENREAMVEVQTSISDKFTEQYNLSLLCNDKDILEYIKLYADDQDELNELEGPSKNPTNEERDNDLYTPERQVINKLVKQFRLPAFSKYLPEQKYMLLPIVVNFNSNKDWYKVGINNIHSEIGNNYPCLVQNTLLSLDRFFPNYESFNIETFDGYKIKAKLGGKFSRELHFINFDIYQYTKKLLGITTNKTISYEDLNNFGYNYYIFQKIDNRNFKMSLFKKE